MNGDEVRHSKWTIFLYKTLAAGNEELCPHRFRFMQLRAVLGSAIHHNGSTAEIDLQSLDLEGSEMDETV